MNEDKRGNSCHLCKDDPRRPWKLFNLIMVVSPIQVWTISLNGNPRNARPNGPPSAMDSTKELVCVYGFTPESQAIYGYL